MSYAERTAAAAEENRTNSQERLPPFRIFRSSFCVVDLHFFLRNSEFLDVADSFWCTNSNDVQPLLFNLFGLNRM
ncbi:hypothetical protein Ancab_035398 [Ancistrocladus abbreviatus]